MRLFVVVLLFTLATVRETLGQELSAECPEDSIDGITNELVNAFGVDNCDLLTYDDFDNCISWDGVECFFSQGDYFAQAEFQHSCFDISCPPTFLEVTSEISGNVTVDFEISCFEEVTSILREVLSIRLPECPEHTYEGVETDLTNAFGEDNCVRFVYDDFENGASYEFICSYEVRGYTAAVVVPGYTAIARYLYSFTNRETVERLAVERTYMDGASNNQVVDFRTSCYDEVEDFLWLVKSNRLGLSPNSCPETMEQIATNLTDIFGEQNCAGQASSNGTSVSLGCSFEVPEYSAMAQLVYSNLPGGDSNLIVQSTYFDGTSVDLFNSFAKGIGFRGSDGCFEDLKGLLFNTVKSARIERDCSNSGDEIVYTPVNKNARTTTCEQISYFNARKRRRFCKKYPQAAEACKGICRTGHFCKCEQNPLLFKVKGIPMTCDQFAAMDATYVEKKRKKFKFRQNCPKVCGCTLSGPGWGKHKLNDKIILQ